MKFVIATMMICKIMWSEAVSTEAGTSYQNQVSGNFDDQYFIKSQLKFPWKAFGLKGFAKDASYYRKFGTNTEYAQKQNGLYNWPNFAPDRSIEDEFKHRNEENSEETQEIFSYNEEDTYGPQNWGKFDKHCDGYNQSPVNLNINNAVSSKNSQPLIIDEFSTEPISIKVENNGHSAKFTLNYPNGKPARFLGGPLKVAYNLDSFHFHWGEVDNAGSEHTLNSRRYSAELHLVTYNSNYATLAKAVAEPKGLAVLSILYELNNTRTDNTSSYNPFFPLLSKVHEPESLHIETKNIFSISDLIKIKNFNYLSYKGSLTTPICLETVTWMVSTTPLKIASYELEELRKIKDHKGNPILKNFRPIQQLNRRRISFY